MNSQYVRKISSDEAQLGYIFVLKQKLGFFPPPGQVFTISTGKQQCRSTVESYQCRCQGPELPHVHYFIRWQNLEKGKEVLISTAGKKKYTLAIRKSARTGE